MEMLEMSTFMDHLLIALVAWIGSLVLGGGVGYLMAHLLRRLMSAMPNNRRIIALVPWRTLLFILILILWSPFLPTRLGIGTQTGMVMVSLTISLVACPMTMSTFLDNWFPQTLHVRLMVVARALLFLALFATLGVGLIGGGGAGVYLIQQVNLLEYGKLLQGVLLLGGMALLLDLILGFVEFWAGYRSPSLDVG
jgi:ABC-type proline/glycine betaine transport system permease subunit